MHEVVPCIPTSIVHSPASPSSLRACRHNLTPTSPHTISPPGLRSIPRSPRIRADLDALHCSKAPEIPPPAHIASTSPVAQILLEPPLAVVLQRMIRQDHLRLGIRLGTGFLSRYY